ncbi:Dimethyl sulfoxide/trimethylamine N-oxide reductase [Rhodovastum atsumiense]|uniref:trimethylamine-N-oxide reductase n=1 Tax=Rhodovastum atsumiense TaxID=504468 RepID=A0A5M6IZH6_9PROT|nr:trimethylamine-N-oxide reductase TorA [Rhodovastum atsumiense]KAA5612758.1 trimethylamine-N-oxide reductase TorA [Rhodovastum atsumiense]CAH2602679.1 Dimethyl sulfoxide/trimethylamine N-oxide reductase [Rhodovastum atsumiense]
MRQPDGAVAHGPGLTRRDLLAGTAASEAIAWLGAGLAPMTATAAPADGEVLTGSHWGAFYGKVENGRFVSARPWEGDPAPSHQLPGVQDVVYSPSRIRHPVVRRAWLEKGPGAAPDSRGTNDFVRITWDRALDLVAGELRRVQEEHGPWAVYGGSLGWKSSGKAHDCVAWLQRLLNLSGGFVGRSGSYSTGALTVIMPHVVGSQDYTEQQTPYPVILQHSDLVVFWGCDLLNNDQITGGVANHSTADFIAALKQSGKQVIFLDPVRNETNRALGGEWIAVRPQTDVALILGIAHTLQAEGLHDRRFLHDYTVGSETFLSYLTGRSDGVAKTAAWAAAISGVPEPVIKDLARRFARQRTFLIGGWAIQRQHHGEQSLWALVTLAAMLGQIGLPGGGFSLGYHLGGNGAPMANGVTLGGIPVGERPAGGKPWPASRGVTTIPCARIVDMLLHPNEEFEFNGRRGIYPDIRLAYWAGGNPFGHHQDRNRQVRAWRKLETFIVQDFQWTASARMADIVLPATTTAERNDIDVLGGSPGTAIIALKQVIAPVAEARNDVDILRGVAARLGLEAVFTNGKTEIEWIRTLYGTAQARGKAAGVTLPDFDTFWRDGIATFGVPETSRRFVRYAAFREDPVLNPLGTPSGLIEITSATIAKMNYADCPPHPTWLEPYERAGAPGTKYPLHVNTKHSPWRLHSQLNGTLLRRSYTVQGREPILIHPEDAAPRGIAEGDVVRVFNDRGQILAGARLTGDVSRGVVVIAEGGWYDPLTPGEPGTLCRYGDVNVLAADIATSRLAQATTGQSIVAEVEKFTGKLPDLKVFTAPET